MTDNRKYLRASNRRGSIFAALLFLAALLLGTAAPVMADQPDVIAVGSSSDQVKIIDLTELGAGATAIPQPTPTISNPTDVAIRSDGGLVFIVQTIYGGRTPTGYLFVADPAQNPPIATTLNLGAYIPTQIALTTAADRMVLGNGRDNKIRIMDPQAFTVLQTLTIYKQSGTGSLNINDRPRAVGYTRDGRLVVGVHNPGGNFVNIYGASVDGLIPEIPDKTIGISASPGRLAIDASPVGRTVVVSSEDGDTISLVDLGTFSTTDLTGSQTGIHKPGDLDITANGTLALVPNTAGTTISVVSLSNPTESRTPIEVGSSPQSVAVISNTHAIAGMSGGAAKIVDLRTSLVVETASDLSDIYHIAVAPWPSFTESPSLTADAGGPYSGIEGTEVALSAAGSSGSDIATYEWDFDGDAIYEYSTMSPTTTHTWADGCSHEIGLRVTDTYGQATDTASVVITNVAPIVSDVTVSINPVAVRADVRAMAAFTDAGTGDTHTVSIDWGDGSTPSAGTVSESGGSGEVMGSHGFASPGLYKVTVTVTDDDGGAGSSTSSDLVVFDPNGGFVTGGGWVPVENGKATFAFVAKYMPGTTTPAGQAKFKLTSAGGDFVATRFDWLVIADGTARIGGTGTIDGRGPYTFILTAVDGGKTDSIQLHAWNADENYDTGPLSLGGGSIIVHS